MEWIDATLQLPQERDSVLLFTPYTVFGNEYTFVGNRESISECTARINREVVPVFTHWMPLPEKPRQQI